MAARVKAARARQRARAGLPPEEPEGISYYLSLPIEANAAAGEGARGDAAGGERENKWEEVMAARVKAAGAARGRWRVCRLRNLKVYPTYLSRN